MSERASERTRWFLLQRVLFEGEQIMAVAGGVKTTVRVLEFD